MRKSAIPGWIIVSLLLLSTLIVGRIMWDFLLVLFLAALTAALVYPLYKKLYRTFRKKANLAVSVTMTILLLCGILPLAGVVGAFVGQAVQISQKIQPKISALMKNESALDDILTAIPYGERLLPYQEPIFEKAGEVISSISLFFVNRLSTATLSAVQSLFLFFLYLYSLFFLIRDGAGFLQRFLYLLPLTEVQEKRLLIRFTAVTKATLKGTLVIGIIQGTLAGVAMALAGIESALFWAILMVILSVIPVVGTILVWLPAGLILLGTGAYLPGILFLLWCSIVVGNIDNLLRPRLVGHDAGLHELLILFSTLGGLSLFGMAGFIVGPVIVALWVTLWEIYGELFSEYLPATSPEILSEIIEPSKEQQNVIDGQRDEEGATAKPEDHDEDNSSNRNA